MSSRNATAASGRATPSVFVNRQPDLTPPWSNGDRERMAIGDHHSFASDGRRRMPGPFIFIATNRLKPEKLADESRRVPDLVDFIRANEPRLLAFNEYANEEGTEVAVV